MTAIASSTTFRPSFARVSTAQPVRGAAAFASGDIADSTAAGDGLPVTPVAGVSGRGQRPDTVELSPQAASSCACGTDGCKGKCDGKKLSSAPGTTGSGAQLSEEQTKQVEKLKQRHEHVVQHEAAHLAAAGSLARSGPKYEYTKGPDGKQYAVGGHVDIDTSAGSTPAETIAKAQRIKAAANAPSDPSGQDQAVAAQAAVLEAKARSEQAQADIKPAGSAAPASEATPAASKPAAKPEAPQALGRPAAEAAAPQKSASAAVNPQQAAAALVVGQGLAPVPSRAEAPTPRRDTSADASATRAFAALVKNAYSAASGLAYR